MNDQQIRYTVLQQLTRIAPEADLAKLNPHIRFRDQFEFDSIDYLNLISSLEKELGVAIPEMDYPKLTTLSGCIAYLGR